MSAKMSKKATFQDAIEFLEGKITSISKNSSSSPSETSSFKKRAYRNVIQKIQQMYSLDEILTLEKIDALPLTANMKMRLNEFLKVFLPSKTKGETKGENKISTADLMKQLTSIAGIGEVGAKKLIEQGVKSVDDLRKVSWFSILPDVTQIFLKHDPTRRIPHEHMKALEPIIIGFQKYKIVMVGSYRRKTPFSRDFDIMLVSDDPKSLIEYETYISSQFRGKLYKYSSGSDRVSFLIQIPKKMLKTASDIVYKFDIFRTPKENQHSMLLYSTGSKLFNIRMRAKAKKSGYLLNQNGLFVLNHDNEPGAKLDIRSERGFFTALDMPWIDPTDRN